MRADSDLAFAEPEADRPFAPFGELLRRYRRAAGFTQEELAERTGLTREAISLLERGARQRPHPYTISQLAAALALGAPERREFAARARYPAPSAPAAATLEGGRPLALGLAAQLTPLLGREHEEAALTHLLQQPEVRLLTLTGPAGVGKTRLALHVIAALQAQGTFADGVASVALAPLSSAVLVARRIAQVLGVQETGGRALVESLIASIRDQHLLLLLDNFEHVLSAAPLLPELLAGCARLVVLVTSRAALRVQVEQQYALAPLALPDPAQGDNPEVVGQAAAVQLFVQRAHAVQPTFALTAQNAAHMAAICRRVDGLPLALELAATRIKLLPPSALLERLERRLAVLVGGARDLPTRQQSLRATLAWSYDLLPASEQALLRRLAVFAGGATLAAAEAVCCVGDDPQGDLLVGLSALADQSLLRMAGTDEEPRVVLLETVREYAWEQLTTAGEETAVRDRHLEWCVALAEATRRHLYGPEQGRGLDRLEAEHDNLRAALAWACEREAQELGLRLAAAVFRFWLLRGYIGEGLGWLEAVLAGGGVASAASRADALLCAGTLAFTRRDCARALTYYEESLALYRELGRTQWIAIALACLADVVGEQGDGARALALREESLALWRERGEPLGIAFSLASLAMAAYGQGDYVRAAALLEESLPIVHALGDSVQIANVLINVGMVAQAQGDHGRAAAHLDESLRLSRDSGATLRVTDGIEILAWVEAARGQSRRAALLGGAAEALREVLGVSLYRPERAGHDHAVQAVLAALGAAAFAATWAEGRAMTEEQAIAYALAAPRVPTSHPRVPASVREPPAAQAAIGQRLDPQEDAERTAQACSMPRPSARRLSRTERQAWALAHLRAGGPLSPRAYAGALAVSVDTALIDLRQLMAHGLVRAEGTTRDRRYILRVDEA